MARIHWRVALCAALIPTVAFAQRIEIEDFENGFSNDFFTHELEFPGCCSDFVARSEAGGWTLHLVPNSDVISFDANDIDYVHSLSVDILDFEGGFVGDQPTSVLIVLGATGDFVVRRAQQIGVLETLEVTGDTPGQLTGLPLVFLLGARLDPANEGNSVFPDEIGAYFDNLTAVTRPFAPPCLGDVDGDLDVDVSDLATLLANFGTAGGATLEQGDLDLDRDVDLSDLAILLANFGAACQ